MNNRVQHIMDFGDWKIVIASNLILPYHHKCRAGESELEQVLGLGDDIWVDAMLRFINPVLTPDMIDQDVPFLAIICARCHEQIPIDVRTAVNIYAGKPIL